jgi:hypothetical protein
VTVAVSAAEVRVFHREKEVARHERLHAKHGTRASLDHYLELPSGSSGNRERQPTHSNTTALTRRPAFSRCCFSLASSAISIVTAR